MSLAVPLLIMYAVLCVIALASRMVDYEKTINQGYPPGEEYPVNFWTGTKVSKKSSDKKDGGKLS